MRCSQIASFLSLDQFISGIIPFVFISLSHIPLLSSFYSLSSFFESMLPNARSSYIFIQLIPTSLSLSLSVAIFPLGLYFQCQIIIYRHLHLLPCFLLNDRNFSCMSSLELLLCTSKQQYERQFRSSFSQFSFCSIRQGA